MEEDKITYQYSKGNCFFYSFFLLWVIFITSLFALDQTKTQSISGILFFGLIILAEVFFLIRITIRYSIAAIRGKVAFEINQQGIIDYARNFTINWGDISDLRMAENKGDATIYFYFKLPNGSEGHTLTRLTWIKGDYLEIYGIIEANLEERGPHQS